MHKQAWKRWILAVLLVCVTATAMYGAANHQATRRFARYYQAVSRADTNISFIEQVVYTLFFTEVGICPKAQKPKATWPS